MRSNKSQTKHTRRATKSDIQMLRAVIDALLTQMYQMRGMFDDEDEAIAGAIGDGEDALKLTRGI